jgi:zinc/manganese transport system ATP-binding protein
MTTTSSPSATDPVLDVSGVGVSLSGRTILHDVSFRIAPGEFVGLIGSNGAGKTTLLRVILGLQASTAGAVSLAGGSGRAAGMIGYLPQKVALDADLPLRARDVVALGLDGQKLGIPLPSRRRRALVDEMLAAVGATDFADTRIGALSGGQQQRVLIAHALISNPRLLLLDEPLANLDIRSAEEIVELIDRVSRERGVAVLLSTHDLNPLLPVMDRIVYLADGRAVAGTIDEVVQSTVLTRLYGRRVDVLRLDGRVLVVAGDDESHGHDEHGHDQHGHDAHGQHVHGHDG